VKPLITAKVEVDLLDVVELASMLPPPLEPREGRCATRAQPGPAVFPPASTERRRREVRVARRAPGHRDRRSFSGHIREGQMTPSPFAANIAKVPFSGAVALDLRGQVPEASLWVAANDVDVGRLLRDFKIVQDLDASVESLRVQLVGRGSRLGMLEKSALELNLDGGHLTMRDVRGKPLIEVALKTGVASSQPEQPVSLTLDGAIDQTPVAIKVSSGTLVDFLRVREYVPFALSAQAAGGAGPEGPRHAAHHQRRGAALLVKGERIDSMNQPRAWSSALGAMVLRRQLPCFAGRLRVPDLKCAWAAAAGTAAAPQRRRHARGGCVAAPRAA
jgi:hypothetical protein